MTSKGRRTETVRADKRPRRPPVLAVLLIGAMAMACLLGSAAPARAGTPTAEQILAKVRAAAGTITCEGVRTLTIRRGPRTVTIKQKVYYGSGKRQRFETIEPQEMAGDVAVSDGRRLWRYIRARNEVRVTAPPPVVPGPPPGPGRGRRGRGHVWTVVGEEQVAGRSCWVLSLRGPHGRQVARLSVDKRTYMVLAASHTSIGGRASEEWRFVTIRYNPKLPESIFVFKPPRGARVVSGPALPRRMPLAKAEQLLGMKALIPKYLPPGYRLVGERTGIVKRGPMAALWLVFTNGTRTFSIFQSRKIPQAGKPPRAVARWDVGPYTLLVVGDVSAEEAEKMRKSLPPPPPPPPPPDGRRGRHRG